MSAGVTYHNPSAAPKPGMYSHVAVAAPGRTAYIAGQTSVGMDGEPLSAGDMAGQIPVVFDNIGRILKDLGCDYGDVLQYTTYLVGSAQREAWQKGRAELYQRIYPDGKFPPNTLLIIEGLARPEFVLEISAIVRLRD